MARHFAHPRLQRVYDWFLANDPATDAGLGHCGRYYCAARHNPGGIKLVPQPGSPARAAWAAGIDNRRKAELGIPKSPTAPNFGCVQFKRKDG